MPPGGAAVATDVTPMAAARAAIAVPQIRSVRRRMLSSPMEPSAAGRDRYLSGAVRHRAGRRGRGRPASGSDAAGADIGRRQRVRADRRGLGVGILVDLHARLSDNVLLLGLAVLIHVVRVAGAAVALLLIGGGPAVACCRIEILARVVVDVALAGGAALVHGRLGGVEAKTDAIGAGAEAGRDQGNRVREERTG